MLHTRANELQLLFLPFLLVLIPFAAASFKQPRHLPGIDRRQFDRLVRNSVGIEQSSTLILLLMQFVAVMAGSSRRMWLAWAAAAPFYLLYVLIRIVGRRYWIRAARLPYDAMEHADTDTN